jgi:hypothetical protein
VIPKVPKYGISDPHMFYNTINLYIIEVWVLFVGDETIETLFSAREPAIQKLPKYGMRDPHMLYKISFHTLY